MGKAAKTPSQKEAENFHVLPKDKPAEAKPSAASVFAAEDQSLTRDAEAGSITGTGDATGVTQSRDAARDRSQVS